jgi:hypothetical protein
MIAGRGEPAGKLRAICMALPGVMEEIMKRGPTFRVEGKIFAWDRTWNDRASVWVKVPKGVQAVLVGADSTRFFIPPFVGTKGWVGVCLDAKPDWTEVESLVRRSYRLVAPRRLADQVSAN